MHIAHFILDTDDLLLMNQCTKLTCLYKEIETLWMLQHGP